MLTQTTKCGLFFLGGVALGALGAVVLTKGDLKVKPLASELLSGGIDLKDKLLAGTSRSQGSGRCRSQGCREGQDHPQAPRP